MVIEDGFPPSATTPTVTAAGIGGSAAGLERFLATDVERTSN
jgi:hypothetical protein